MNGKSMRWEGFSLKVNTGSRMVNTDSRKWGKSVHVQQESLFTFDRNGCSRWAGIGVQLAREYAKVQPPVHLSSLASPKGLERLALCKCKAAPERAFNKELAQLIGLEGNMTFVVGEGCINCKHTDCVEVCPVDCFYEDPNMLVIEPDDCIDCALCEPECPEEAIFFSEGDLPEDQAEFLTLAARLSSVWPNITEMKDSPSDAEEWSGVSNKRQYLKEMTSSRT